MAHADPQRGAAYKREWEAAKRLQDPALFKAMGRAKTHRYRDTVQGRLSQLLGAASRRAKEFDLCLQDLLDLYEAQEGRCAKSGLPMTYSGRGLCAFRISVDRINSKRGYVKGNVRLVCFAMNCFFGAWGDEIALQLAVAFVNKASNDN